MKKFAVIIEQDTDGWYVASVPVIAGCYTQGKTLEEALDRIKEAILLCLDSDDSDVLPNTFVKVEHIEV